MQSTLTTDGRRCLWPAASRALLILLLPLTGWAQLVDPNPDWQESDVPPPPAFDLRRLEPLDMGQRTQLRWGVDPATIRIGDDGVVRYVIVAHGPSTVNALYEGLRCATGEVRVYARRIGDQPWLPNPRAEWLSLREHMGQRHSWEFGRAGACDGRSTPRTVSELLVNLRGQNPERQR